MTVNVLLSSAGRRVSLLNAFRSTLEELKLTGRLLAADAATYSAASCLADGRFRVPPCGDPGFVPAMLELCEREGVTLLVPTIDTELPAYAAHRADFAAVGTLVAVSSPATIDISADKRRTHDFLVSRGLPTVAQAEVEQVLADRERWRFPFIVKPVNGSASEGVVLVENEAQFAAATCTGDVVVQTVAPGREFTMDVFVDGDGVCHGVVPRERLEVRGGEVSKARTVRNESLIALAEGVTKTLPAPFGVLNLQAFHDRDTAESRIIEINPRFGGGFPLAHRAGAPFTRWLLELALGRPVDWELREWRAGLVMLRYDEGVFLDEASLNPQ
jgi:carbamoyl-phosphate synthase large subunit